MGGEDSDIKVYEYIGADVDAEVEAYIILYPIAEMELDLEEYIDRITQDDIDFTYDIPPEITHFQGPFPTEGLHLTQDGSQDDKPLFTIDVADMAKLVKEVTGEAFGLELEEYNQGFQDNLWVMIPALGIDEYKKGVVANGKLRFLNSSPPQITLYPQQAFADGIAIYVKTMGLISGKLAPKLVFEWTKAEIQTDEGIKGDFPLNNKDLAGFFGDGVKFKEAKGYIYTGGVGDDAKMSLNATNGTVSITKETLLGRQHPRFTDRFDAPIPEHSLADDPYIPMTDMLNDSITEEINLEYDLTIGNKTISKANPDEDDIIFVDLVILLPLEFTTTTPSDNLQYADQYAKLDLEGFSPDMGDEDLFRRQGNNDDLFNSIKTVKFILSNIQNDILGGKVSFMIDTGNKAELLDFSQSRPWVEFDIRDMPPPFIPRFEILIEKDKSGEALFSLKRINPGNDHAAFDFSLTVEVKTDIDQTITF